MASNFGPWATTLDMELGATLGRFWRQRIIMLRPVRQAGPAPSGRAASVLVLFALLTLAAPLLLLSRSPAAAPEIAAESPPSPAQAQATGPAAPPQEPTIENLPAGMADDLIEIPSRPGEFLHPVGLATVTCAPLEAQGALAIDPTRLMQVRSRFPGEIVSIGTFTPPPAADGAAPPAKPRPLRAGDFVKKGDVLATVWSKDVGEKKGDFLNALLQLKLDRQQLSRLQQLDAGVVPKSNLREAEHTLELDQLAVERVEQTLRMWRLADSEIADVRARAEKGSRQDQNAGKVAAEATWGEVAIKAPFDGTILERNAVTSQVLDTDAKLFTIADLSQLMVVTKIFEQNILELKALPSERRRWSLRINTEPAQRSIASQIDTIGETIDPNTRSGEVIGSVDNAAGLLLPGLAVTVTITDPAVNRGYLAVPHAAVLQRRADQFPEVWLETDASKAAFQWRRVVWSGLSPPKIALIQEIRDAEGRAPEPQLKLGSRVVVWGPAQRPVEE